LKSTDPRQIAFDLLCRVEEGAYADLALDGALSRLPGLDPRDRALATELLYGTLRCRGRLVLALLRLGAYQLLQLDRIPAPAAVHATVELARKVRLERASGFVNAVLRSLLRERETIPWPDPAAEPLAYLEHVLSLPGWLAGRWLKEFGAGEAIALAEAMLHPAPFTVRVNLLRQTREAYLERLRAAGFAAEPTRFAPEGVTVSGRGGAALPGSAEGWFQVQDEASMLVARLLGARGGERLLDACAAPGGKTTQLAALTGNAASILALDLHPERLRLVEAGARRLGCAGIETRPCDLSRPPDFLVPAGFDRALVDAPCSGLGVLRRNPESRWRRAEADIARLAGLQQAILGHVAPLVRPGGTLLYSVCTCTPEETDGVVAAFLAVHPEYVREDMCPAAPPEWEELFDGEGALRTFPHRHGGMDAFYAARLRRNA
jgi:16S rRNA (cytosine967-C5)-methyltransferase